MSPAQLKVSERPLVEAYDCAMLDLDGVIYVGPHAVDGVPEVLARARSRGMTLAFVTNNAARTPAQVAAHLTELGIEAVAADVVTSAQAAAREVARLVPEGSRVLVVGGEGLNVALRELGLVPVASADDEPVAIVQGFHPAIGWAALAEGALAAAKGLPWIASNLDLTIPTARGIAPGNGALVQAVATASGRRPDAVAGKPYRPLFDETLLRVASSRPLVVGDRLDTDIEGANRVDTDSLLVMTGVTDLETICLAPAEHRPTYISMTLEALLHPVGAPTARAAGWERGRWRVTCRDGRILVEASGDDPDAGLACVVSAAWAWIDGQEAPELAGLDAVAACLGLVSVSAR